MKAIIAYSKFLEPSISFYEIENKSQVISFLDAKIKNSEDDPDIRWIMLKKKDNRIIENVNYQKCNFILPFNNKSHKIKVY